MIKRSDYRDLLLATGRALSQDLWDIRRCSATSALHRVLLTT